MGYALVIGSSGPREDGALAAAAQHSNAHLDRASVAEMVERLQAHAHEPCCVVVTDAAEVRQVVERLRDHGDLLTVPVIASLSHPAEHLLGGAFADGADDVVIAGDRGALVRRFASLKSAKNRGPAQGVALVACSDPAKRRIWGQALRRAGFDAQYAADQAELRGSRAASVVSLAVIAEDFPQGADEAIAALRASAGNPALPALVVAARGTTRTVGYDASANLNSQLLSFAEEVARGDLVDQRASKRLPYATMVGFRTAGSLLVDFALSHNVSFDGVFVRTLDPPRSASVTWIELRPPNSDTVVHLRAEVVWRREPGTLGATPFGFGARILDSQCPPEDLRAYRVGYERGISPTGTSEASEKT